MIFKKIQKKDETTRCKALKSLEDRIIQLTSEPDGKRSSAFVNVVAFYLYHYQRIMTYEVSKGVRESAQQAFATIVREGKKSSLSSHMSNLFPVWFSTCYDSSPEVARLGRALFEDCFGA